MDIRVVATPLASLRDDALLVLLRKGQDPAAALRPLGNPFPQQAQTLVDRKAFAGDDGQVRALTGTSRGRLGTVVLVGLGGEQPLDMDAVRRGAAAGVRAARDHGARSVSIALPGGRGAARADRLAGAAAEGAVLGLYRFEAYKSEKAKTGVDVVTIVAPRGQRAAAERGAREGQVIGEAVLVARDLGNEPGNSATPTYLAQRALAIAREEGLEARVFDEADMRAMGMGALLGVAKGSHEPAKLIVLRYEPRGGGRRDTVAIVGKGLTFDTGGISIKPAARLEEMKFDMCGGAAVIAAMQAVARLKVGVRVVGIVPSTENMPGGGSYKPGDILRAMNGVTIEVKNTDAEGRLILADALSWATMRLKPKPKAIIDLATLTGACVVALGDQCAGLVSTDEALAARIERASEESGDAVWRLPLKPGYRKQIESTFADVSNLGGSGAGALTAAAFLQKFTGDVPWAHLDIAGTAWTDREEGYRRPGATGFGVRVLARLLQRWGRAT
jgi:leucyl aminopeptidase